MLDSATPASEKSKKKLDSSRSAKRFWPETIANLKSTDVSTTSGVDESNSEEGGEVTYKSEGGGVRYGPTLIEWSRG